MTHSKDNAPTIFHWFVLLALGLMWGSSFLFIKKSVDVYSPEQMTFVRMVIAWLIYLPFGLIWWRKIDWSQWRPLLIVALCGSGFPNYFFAVGEQTVSSGVAGVLNSLVPLFTLGLGVFFFNSKTTTTKTGGILLGLAGAIFLIFYSTRGEAAGGGKLFHALLCIAAAFMYAINANTVGAYLKGMNSIVIGAASFMLFGPIYLVGAWLTGGFPVAFDPKNWQATSMVLYLAVIGTVAASVIYVWLVQRTSAVFATSVAYLFPVFSLALGLLDGESVGWGHVAGAGLVLGGLYLSRK